jgi:2-dehydropantoate 2-reductase
MRYIIYGAGAIGCTIGARLHRAGCPVALIARGEQLDALRSGGLTLVTPEGELKPGLQAVACPRELELARDDAVFLAMKSHDTAAALVALGEVSDPETPIICAQNGVENERLALRRFEHVYGMFVWVTAEHLKPGVVRAFARGALGVLDIGRVPHGIDERAARIAQDMQAAGFTSQVDPEIMRWKYAKLLSNLGNAVEALIGPDAAGGELVRRARAEALDCYAAAGVRYVSEAELSQRVADNEDLHPIDDEERRVGSSWQSLARGSRRIETEYLNGEIVLLGRLHGIPTPVNQALTEWAIRMARDAAAPGSANTQEIEATIKQISKQA